MPGVSQPVPPVRFWPCMRASSMSFESGVSCERPTIRPAILQSICSAASSVGSRLPTPKRASTRLIRGRSLPDQGTPSAPEKCLAATLGHTRSRRVRRPGGDAVRRAVPSPARRAHSCRSCRRPFPLCRAHQQPQVSAPRCGLQPAGRVGRNRRLRGCGGSLLMAQTVFWSWQSDRPARETRQLIRDALSDAIARIHRARRGGDRRRTPARPVAGRAARQRTGRASQ